MFVRAAPDPDITMTTGHNNPLVNIEKGPNFHLEEAAAPSRPTGRIALAPHLESAEFGDPFRST
eukprot:15442583-Alexandrium_andersonii.AAC.1